jgi:hypothetical protein
MLMKKAIRGRFVPAPLPGGDLQLGWFAISSRWIESVTDRRRLHGHWCSISDTEKRTRIFRLLRLAPNLKGGSSEGWGAIAIDWPGKIDLDDFAGEEKDREMLLVIEPVRDPIRLFLCVWKHPDPSQRLLLRVSVWLTALTFVASVPGML